MTSTNTNMEAHLDEQPPAKKSRIDDMNADEQKEELETSTTTVTVDLPRPRHRKLPAELNREIYLCFNSAAQRKFIWGLGWNFYAMFRYRLLRKTKRLRNPTGNIWNSSRTRRVNAMSSTQTLVYAMKGFPISRELSRKDNYPGTILYYFEVTVFKFEHKWSTIALGLYSFGGRGHHHAQSVLDGRGTKEIREAIGGLPSPSTIQSDIGKPISICSSVADLFPSVRLSNCTIVANFGDDQVGNPFVYDINNCPGLGLACI